MKGEEGGNITMAYFKDAAELYEVFGKLFDRVRTDPKVGRAIANINMVFQYHYTDPDSWVTINARDKPAEGYLTAVMGETDLKPDVYMEMDADFAHEFYLGKGNVMVAMTRGRIKSRGKMTKLLKLLPVIKPIFAMYRKVLEEMDREDLLM
jgi:hypothetical protein